MEHDERNESEERVPESTDEIGSIVGILNNERNDPTNLFRVNDPTAPTTERFDLGQVVQRYGVHGRYVFVTEDDFEWLEQVMGTLPSAQAMYLSRVVARLKSGKIGG